jgi:hypothetical protein
MKTLIIFTGGELDLFTLTKKNSLISVTIENNLNIKGKCKGRPCTGTEALYRPYGP